jgi:hypothetical protein
MKKGLDDSVKRMLSEIAIKTAWKELKESGKDNSNFSTSDKDDQKCLFGYTIEREERIYIARSYVTLPNMAKLQNVNDKYQEMIKKYCLRFEPSKNSLTGQVFDEDRGVIVEIVADRSDKNKRNLAIGPPIETTRFREYKSWISSLLNSTLGMVDIFDNN